MALAQGWAFWLAWRGRRHSLWLWLTPPIVAQALMILMVPSNADIFFYEMTGDMAANGINPYAQALMEYPSNPLLPYNHWVEMTAVYGPVWTSVNAAIMSTTGADPVLATIVFKVFLGIVALSLSVLVYWLAKLLTESAQLATVAAVLVAWATRTDSGIGGTGAQRPCDASAFNRSDCTGDRRRLQFRAGRSGAHVALGFGEVRDPATIGTAGITSAGGPKTEGWNATNSSRLAT